MRFSFAFLAAPVCAAILLAGPAWAQPAPQPAGQAQTGTRSDDDSDVAQAGADDQSKAQLDSFGSFMKKGFKGIKKAGSMMKDIHTGFAPEGEVDEAQPQERAIPPTSPR